MIWGGRGLVIERGRPDMPRRSWDLLGGFGHLAFGLLREITLEQKTIGEGVRKLSVVDTRTAWRSDEALVGRKSDCVYRYIHDMRRLQVYESGGQGVERVSRRDDAWCSEVS